MSAHPAAQVRRAMRGDLDVVVPLFDAYRQFYGQPSDRLGAQRFLESRLAREEAVILLAQSDSVAVGFTLLYPGFSSVAMARTWLLNDLFVTPAARRGGIGLTLLAAAADFARQRGAYRISLETTRDNEVAQALYRRAGWLQDDTHWFHLDLRDHDHHD